MSSPALDELLDATSDLSRRIGADPRLAAANLAWQKCMDDHGHPAKATNDPLNEIEARARPMYDAPTWDKTAAKKLHAEELEIADIDWTCRVATINPALKTVRNEIEGAYVEEHPDLVAKVRTEMKALIGR